MSDFWNPFRDSLYIDESCPKMTSPIRAMSHCCRDGSLSSPGASRWQTRARRLELHELDLHELDLHELDLHELDLHELDLHEIAPWDAMVSDPRNR
jgi:hypothetical protein